MANGFVSSAHFARCYRAEFGRRPRHLGRCLVAVSEGVHGPDGKTLVESKEKDSHGNVQLSGSGALGDLLAAEIKQKLGAKLRVRADTFGYLLSSFLSPLASTRR